MKPECRKKARELRLQGKSIKEIEKILQVSRSSVSRWVKDISLTENQLEKLNDSSRRTVKASATRRRRGIERRTEYQNNGKKKAENLKNDPLFISGCMLYWAEGSKSRHSISFTNSDVNMCKLFKYFIKKFWNIRDDDMALYINCYAENDMEVEDAENYWVSALLLSRKNLRKSTVNCRPKQKKHNEKKLKKGICRITINNTEVLHEIYGAIQYFGSFSTDEWIG